jgi:hypothetical protein
VVITSLLRKPNLRQPRNRSVSTRRSSRSTRQSSMIVHDINEDEPSQEESENQPGTGSAAPRTRKAKETQRRLGVGRPVVAGEFSLTF